MAEGQPKASQNAPQKVDQARPQNPVATQQAAINQLPPKREGGKDGYAEGRLGKRDSDYGDGEYDPREEPQQPSKDATPKEEPEDIANEGHAVKLTLNPVGVKAIEAGLWVRCHPQI